MEFLGGCILDDDEIIEMTIDALGDKFKLIHLLEMPHLIV